jgi:MFS family permease
VLIGLGVLVLVGFGLHQRHRAHTGRTPTVEPSLFVRRAFPAALAASTLFFAVMNGLMLVIVVYMQLGLHTNALIAGLTLLPWSAGLAFASPIAGNYLIPRYGPKVMYAGLAVQLAGLIGSIAAYPTAEPGSYPWLLLITLFVAGLGIGLFTATFFTTALAQVSPHENGSAAGLLNAVQQVGATLGVAILGSVYFAVSDHGALRAVQDAFGLAAVILAATAVPAVLMTARRRARQTGPT